MITISIVGPESTGKTDLAQQLAHHYRTHWVKEYAREYLTALGRPYEQQDLSLIAKRQAYLQDEAQKSGHALVIFDTDLLVLKVWSEYKYGKVDPFILAQLALQRPDLYILTYCDVPYEEDPLREHPTQRDELYDIYQKELETMGASYLVVKGDKEERKDQATTIINRLL